MVGVATSGEDNHGMCVQPYPTRHSYQSCELYPTRGSHPTRESHPIGRPHRRNTTRQQHATKSTRFRLALMLLLAVTIWNASPPPAAADAAEPGGTESVIDRLVPEPDGVSLTAIAGDAFLELSVDPGREVVILGYDEEPYLRVLPDGTVEQNSLSPAVGLNEGRYGGDIGVLADSSAEPRWVVIGDGGRTAWHDHRTHWMLESDPVAAPDGVIQEFDVPLEVDGERVLAEGRLLLVDDPFPWAYLVAAALAVATYFLVPVLGALNLLWASGLIAVILSWTSWTVNPVESAAKPWPLGLALGALVLTAVAQWRKSLSPQGKVAAPGEQSRTISVLTDPFFLGAVAALTGWWVFRWPYFSAAVIPSVAPVELERLGSAVVCGITVGLVVRVVVGSSQRRIVEAS